MRVIRYLFAAVLLLTCISNVAAQNPLEARLMITPNEAVVEPGQGLQFKALLFNSQGTPLRIDKLFWSVLPDSLASISEDGFLMAGRREGEVKIVAKAQAGQATYAAEAHAVIGRGPSLPVRIIVEPGEAIVPPLGTQQFKALIATPDKPPQPAARAKWEVIPNSLGKIDPNSGLFTAGNGVGFGAVVAFVEFNNAIFRGEARVIVASATAAIAGNVKDQKTGNAIAKAVVWADHIGPFRFARRVETDEQGNYIIEKLIAGLYVVRAEAKEYLPEFYDNAAFFEQSTPVRVADNETKKDIDFSLSPGATISGLVTRDSDKTPIAGSHVFAILVVRPDLKHHAVADENGNYKINPLPNGTYAVAAEAPGFKGEFYKDKRDLLSADHITVQEGQTAGDVDFGLATASAISGKAVDAVTKEPVAKALISIHVLINNSNRPPRLLLNVLTDEHGEYIANTPPGFYIVAAEARGYHKEFFEGARDFTKAKPVQVFEDKHTININFTMDKLASISGVVTDEATGKPIAEAIVSAFPEGPTTDPLISKDALRLPYVAKTDENGNYKLEGVRTGKYFVQAVGRGYLLEFWKEASDLKNATPVDVPESGNVDHIDFTLGQGGAMSGIVLSAAEQKPIAGAAVQIFLKDSRMPIARGESGRDGKYRIDGLRSGDYIVFASAEGFGGLYYKDVEQLQNATLVKVEAPKETPDIDFHLKPFDRRGGTIAGAVISEADKNPIPHALVLVIPMGGPSTVPGAPLFAMADDFGKYKIAGVPTGKYVALAAAPRFISEFFDNARSFREATIFGVDNNVVEINFALTPAQRGAYQIAGHVRHRSQNRGVENALVQALDGGAIVATALTGSDGSFTLAEMPAGDFKISATSALGDAEQQVPVSVGNGRSVANVELILGTTSVKDANAPVPDKFALEQNFPNPFNPETSIKYHLPVRTNVTLRIYNALGQEVRTLINELQDAGVYNAPWDGKDKNGRQLSTGLYLFRLEAGDFVMTRKMAMVK
jgi:protocatechuate 3,4-dioxygenase beta subunit